MWMFSCNLRLHSMKDLPIYVRHLLTLKLLQPVGLKRCSKPGIGEPDTSLLVESPGSVQSNAFLILISLQPIEFRNGNSARLLCSIGFT